MAISDSHKKLLWGKAAAFCSRPGCGADLTRGVRADAYVLGEMAHIVAQAPSGPRGEVGGGEDIYENLLLLCPTCHSEIDKAPDKFPADLLRSWKEQHEKKIRSLGSKKNLIDLMT